MEALFRASPGAVVVEKHRWRLSDRSVAATEHCYRQPWCNYVSRFPSNYLSTGAQVSIFVVFYFYFFSREIKKVSLGNRKKESESGLERNGRSRKVGISYIIAVQAPTSNYFLSTKTNSKPNWRTKQKPTDNNQYGETGGKEIREPY